MRVVLVLAIAATLPSAALAEMHCEPSNVTVQYPESDPVFVSETSAWKEQVLSARYIEGKDASSCKSAPLDDYAEYPTLLCAYSAKDQGTTWKPTNAKVIVLEPSARQLAIWGITACRSNGATTLQMVNCLENLRGYVKNQNAAQFPIIGSVVESKCGRHGTCKGLPANALEHRPDNTWFRDGISVDYKASFHTTWGYYDYQNYETLLDPKQSDAYLNTTYNYSRVSGAQRADWIAWLAQATGANSNLDADTKAFLRGLPQIEDTNDGRRDWQTVSREVHKRACRGAENLLFDAVVFVNKTAWIN